MGRIYWFVFATCTSNLRGLRQPSFFSSLSCRSAIQAGLSWEVLLLSRPDLLLWLQSADRLFSEAWWLWWCHMHNWAMCPQYLASSARLLQVAAGFQKERKKANPRARAPFPPLPDLGGLMSPQYNPESRVGKIQATSWREALQNSTASLPHGTLLSRKIYYALTPVYPGSS